uniref:Uncharacterized protein n=1 Tax=Cyprinus carpio TaxID=7962 RepID=A0A8C2GDZ5_CYPCA
SVALLSMQSKKTLRFLQKYLNLCSQDERRSLEGVWIYSVYPPNYNQTMAGDAYCNKTLYLFAFWTTTLGNILLGLVLLCGSCVWACIRDEFVELVCCVALALD